MVEIAIFRLVVAASLIKASAASGQSLVVEQVPKRRVGIGNASDHQECSPKFWNISARLASISSADGACPYLANMPRPVLKGAPDDWPSSADARSRSRTSQT